MIMKNNLLFLLSIFTSSQACAFIKPVIQKEIVSSDPFCYEARIKAYENSQRNLIIGFIDYGINMQSGYANIATLHVEPQFRKKGIASKLICMALEDIKRRSPLTIAVTLQANPQAPDMTLDQLIVFYTKCGAEFEGFEERNGIRFARMRFKLQ